MRFQAHFRAGLDSIHFASLNALTLDEADATCRGAGHLRLSYVNSRENIGLALERMGEVLSRMIR